MVSMSWIPYDIFPLPFHRVKMYKVQNTASLQSWCEYRFLTTRSLSFSDMPPYIFLQSAHYWKRKMSYTVPLHESGREREIFLWILISHGVANWGPAFVWFHHQVSLVAQTRGHHNLLLRSIQTMTFVSSARPNWHRRKPKLRSDGSAGHTTTRIST